MVPTGGARRCVARSPRHRARTRLRSARRGQPVLRHGRVAGAKRPRVDAHDEAGLERHVVDGRSGARRARPRPCARRHSRRSEAVQHHARSVHHGSGAPGVRARSRTGLAARVPPRLPSRRGQRTRGCGALGGRDRRMGGSRADPPTGHTRGSGNGPLRPRMRDVPGAQRARGLRGQRAGRAARSQANRAADTQSARRGPVASGQVRPQASGEEALEPLRVRGGRPARLEGDQARQCGDSRGDDARRAGFTGRPRRVRALAGTRYPEPSRSHARGTPRGAGRALERHRSRGEWLPKAGSRGPHRRSRRRQEPHRGVALRGGARAGRHAAPSGPVRPHAVSPRRDHRRSERPFRPHRGRSSGRRADAHDPLGGREGRRRLL